MFPVRVQVDGRSLLMNSRDCESFWDPLYFFLNLPAIQMLRREEVEKALGFLWEFRDIRLFEEYLFSRLSVSTVEDLRRGLSQTDYQDLYTLADEILQTKPGRVLNKSYWDESFDFFENQVFYFRLPDSSFTYRSPVIKCQKDRNGALELILQGGTRVKISSGVEIDEVKRRKFSSLVQECFIGIRNQFWIEYEGNNNAFPPKGLYHLQSVKNEKCLPMVALFLRASDYDGLFDLDLTFGPQKRPFRLHFYYKLGSFGTRSIVKIGKGLAGKSSMVPLTFLKQGLYVTTTRHDFKKVLNAKEAITFIPQTVQDRKPSAEVFNELGVAFDQLVADFEKEFDENLIERYLENPLLSVEEARKINSVFMQKIEKLNDRHNHVLGTSHSPIQMLHRFLDESIHLRFTGKRRHPLLHNILELLGKSREQSEELKGKGAVFFFGNTGSGKSTMIAHLLGAKMSSKKNPVGELVFDFQEDQEAMPTIGHSLSQSETLYARGYPIRQNVLLCDCPGFNDTRGPDFDFCANLSIDRAVSSAGYIQAVVVVVPIQAFLVDRTTPFVELIEQIRERFPFAFDETQPGNEFVHLLITKQEQVEPGIVEGIQDGSRLGFLYQEAAERLKTSMGEVSELELNLIERRASLWKSLLSMHKQGRVRCSKLGNARDRNRLLQFYAPEGMPGLGKEKYVPFVQGQDIQEKFGGWLRQLLENWTFTLHQALQGLPDEIKLERQGLILKEREREQHAALLKKKQEEKPMNPSHDEMLRYRVEEKGLQTSLALISHEIQKKERIIQACERKKRQFDLMIKKENATIQILRDLSRLGQGVVEDEEMQAVCGAFLKAAKAI
ncbi:MAG: GTPase domain-containing protein [Chlamydiae bacterium]|nr:GTPase domain-containing protein [Chlamydiota bacterium]